MKSKSLAAPMTAAAAAGTTLALSNDLVADVVSHFHVNTTTASMIIAAATGAGSWVVSVLFPEVLPYLLTIRGLIAVIGVGATTGW